MGTHGSINIYDERGSYKVELHTQSKGDIKSLLNGILDLPENLVRLSTQNHKSLYFYSLIKNWKCKTYQEVIEGWIEINPIDIGRPTNLASLLILNNPYLYVCHPDFMDEHDFKYNTMESPLKITIIEKSLSELIIEAINDEDQYSFDYLNQIIEISNQAIPKEIQTTIGSDMKILFKIDSLTAFKTWQKIREIQTLGV